MDRSHYDLLIVGSGSGGYSAALKAAENNIKVGVIEQAQIGGTCLNKGCIPTKTYLHLAKTYRNLVFNPFIADTRDIYINRKEITNKIISSVEQLTNGLSFSLKKSGVDIFYGIAKAENKNKIQILGNDGKSIILTYEYLILATGAEPIIPEFVKLSNNIFTTDNAFCQDNIVPESIVIIGGGIIGVEFASILSCFGTKVTLIELKNRLVSDFSKDISVAVKGMLQRRDVVVKTGTSISSISEEDDEVYLETKNIHDNRESILTEKALIAVGRKPKLDKSFLNNLEIKMEGTKIVVDSNYCTSNDKIYAIGDVCCPMQLAYVAAKQGEQVVDNILNNSQSSIKNVPKCIFMETEVAQVGITEDEPSNVINTYIMAKLPLKANSMGVLQGHIEGYSKLIAIKDSGKIVGAELVCPHAVDMIELCKDYIDRGYTVNDLIDAVFPHPSYVELIKDTAKMLAKEIKK